LTISDINTAVSRAANGGDNDASPDNTPSQFLLLRGLEPSVTEELLAKGVAKLFKPSGSSIQSSQALKKGAKVASTTGDSNLGAREGTLRRVLLVRDRRSNDSWRFGFAEFASIEDAQAALTRFNSFERFTIASKQVMVSYIHAGVFVPVINPAASTERFTFSPLSNPSLKLQYWDEDAYVGEVVVTMGEHIPTEKSSKSTAATSVDKEGFKAAKEGEKTKKRKADIAASNTTTKKVTSSHLQFWSNRHAELHGLGPKNASEDQSHSKVSVDGPPSQSYADPTRHCCYLCLRQFNSVAEVNKHERLSELHRTNLQDEELVKKAQAKLQKHGIQPQQAGVEYRDRAKERRKIYGVVNKKGEQVGNGPKASKAPSDDEDVPVQSKGASLLSKMGYTVGQGLGASGEGRTAPINQDIYVAGVGLGAEGGKLGDALSEAERNTKGEYSGFAERTKEGARERYSRM
jgi:RNA recognition motif-containing protein